MGLLDLPGPVFSAVDGVLGDVLPAAARLVVWALAGAIVSMELYRLLSPQARVAELRVELDVVQRKVAAYDGPFDGAWPLIGRMLLLALKRIGIILPGTILASLPVLTLILWLDTAYGHGFPAPGEAVPVTVSAPFKGEWQGDRDGPPHALVLDGSKVVVNQPVKAPVPVVAKHHWWNFLIGNPAGYLDRDAPVEGINLALPAKQIISVGPSWARGWEPVFFAGIIIFALTLKRIRRIE